MEGAVPKLMKRRHSKSGKNGAQRAGEEAGEAADSEQCTGPASQNGHETPKRPPPTRIPQRKSCGHLEVSWGVQIRIGGQRSENVTF